MADDSFSREIFVESYWKRPAPKDRGAANAEQIYLAVGHALSWWERADQALADLFMAFTDIDTVVAREAVRRAYGSISGNAGRRAAVRAAAEVYLHPHWETNKNVRQPVIDVLNAVQWASNRRDDIAHGVVWDKIELFGTDYGAFHMPPEYNSERTRSSIGRFSGIPDSDDDPLNVMRVRYRYTADDINEFGRKFRVLSNAIGCWPGTYVYRDADGSIPLVRGAAP